MNYHLANYILRQALDNASFILKIFFKKVKAAKECIMQQIVNAIFIMCSK